MTTNTTTSQSATSLTRNKLDLYTRWGLWALLVWAALLVYGTLTHQPAEALRSAETPTANV